MQPEAPVASSGVSEVGACKAQPAWKRTKLCMRQVQAAGKASCGIKDETPLCRTGMMRMRYMHPTSQTYHVPCTRRNKENLNTNKTQCLTSQNPHQ